MNEREAKPDYGAGISGRPTRNEKVTMDDIKVLAERVVGPGYATERTMERKRDAETLARAVLRLLDERGEILHSPQCSCCTCTRIYEEIEEDEREERAVRRKNGPL